MSASVVAASRFPSESPDSALKITEEDLAQVFRLKHNDPERMGWLPRLHQRMGYYTPDEYYEAMVAKLVTEGCSWIDLGCGHDLFPHNQQLAAILSKRCGLLVGVDPDETLNDNPFVHEKVRSTIDSYHTTRTFDVLTLRMVAEHIADPATTLEALARLSAPGSKVVVYTVNLWAPLSVLAWLIPFRFHHAIKRLVWGTEERDTFPVVYKLNTRHRLKESFARHGFQEVFFSRPDDCRTLSGFRWPHLAELFLWRLLKAVGASFPENCLLGVYERV
jgi:2-polyprenyl-3-methyl-5-hydroxy-6-metoxy-1,4-benzoquinol methylase